VARIDQVPGRPPTWCAQVAALSAWLLASGGAILDARRKLADRALGSRSLTRIDDVVWMRGLPAIAVGPAAQANDAPAWRERFLVWPVRVFSGAHTVGAGEREPLRTRARGLWLMCLTGRGPGGEAAALSGPLGVTPSWCTQVHTSATI